MTTLDNMRRYGGPGKEPARINVAATNNMTDYKAEHKVKLNSTGHFDMREQILDNARTAFECYCPKNIPTTNIDFRVVVYSRDVRDIDRDRNAKNTSPHPRKCYGADVIFGPMRLPFIERAVGVTAHEALEDLLELSARAVGRVKNDGKLRQMHTEMVPARLGDEDAAPNGLIATQPFGGN